MRSASRYLVLGGICLVALTLYSTLAPRFELWQFVLVAVVAAGIGQLVVVRASQRTKSQAPIVAQAQRIDSSSSVVPAVEDTYRLIDELGLDTVVAYGTPCSTTGSRPGQWRGLLTTALSHET